MRRFFFQNRKRKLCNDSTNNYKALIDIVAPRRPYNFSKTEYWRRSVIQLRIGHQIIGTCSGAKIFILYHSLAGIRKNIMAMACAHIQSRIEVFIRVKYNLLKQKLFRYLGIMIIRIMKNHKREVSLTTYYILNFLITDSSLGVQF